MNQYLVKESNGAEKIYIGNSATELEKLFNVKVIAYFCKLPN